MVGIRKIGINTHIFGMGRVGFSSEYQTVYDSFTTKPSAAVAAAQNTRVKTLVDDGVWTKKDIDYVFAAHINDNGEALTNWFNPGTFNAVLVNAPAFVAFEGFTGDGSTSYIMAYIPSSDGTLYLQDDAHAGDYIRTHVVENDVDFRANDGSNFLTMASVFTGSNFYGINQGGADGVANADARGDYLINRVDSTDNDLYKNGVILNDNSTVSTGAPTVRLYICAANNSGSPANFSTKQHSLFSLGGSFSGAEIISSNNANETYMDSNGKGIAA